MRCKYGYDYFESVAWAFHGQPAKVASDLDIYEAPTGESYTKLLRFFVAIRRYMSGNKFHMLACNLASKKHFPMFQQLIKDNCNVCIEASTDVTGNPMNGGNWVMETNGEDIRPVYTRFF